MRATADPVRVLMYRHRELCERAVDPLEIAAGLEACGLTDRNAARFRHRDVFSLAEELYARVPRGEPAAGGAAAAGPGPAPAPRRATGRALLPLLPGLLCAAAFAAAAGPVPAAAAGPVALAGPLLAAATAAPVLLERAERRAGAGAGLRLVLLCALPLLGYALVGDAVLGELSPLLPLPPAGDQRAAAAATALTLALSVAPAAWTLRWFRARARLCVARARSTREFAAAVRPLLAGAVLGFGGALAALHALVREVLPPPAGGGPVPPTALPALLALGLLLYAALLLVAHGRCRAAASALGAVCAALLTVLCTAAAAWLPALRWAGRPVAALAGTHGPGAVTVLVCGAAAAGLLAYAARVLTGACAHRPAGPAPDGADGDGGGPGRGRRGRRRSPCPPPRPGPVPGPASDTDFGFLATDFSDDRTSRAPSPSARSHAMKEFHP
ncbi:hypothetical protein [Streptomyces aidingensis]|uniref:Integral membrane protein n=1 Tax=Streptomyces aidingensis TaxID=910347 RepID=A0A1I1F0T3_9ACTN|nr:hypothetical protein [Streptomyces aidingensis]SFB91368.1 hypothetical protein SAMN05421773_101496 [Streptomyces aidingensis]